MLAFVANTSQHQHLGCGIPSSEIVDQVHTAAIAQIEVDDRDICPDAGSQQVPGFRQRSGLPNDLQIGLAVEQDRQRLARELE